MPKLYRLASEWRRTFDNQVCLNHMSQQSLSLLYVYPAPFEDRKHDTTPQNVNGRKIGASMTSPRIASPAAVDSRRTQRPQRKALRNTIHDPRLVRGFHRQLPLAQAAKIRLNKPGSRDANRKNMNTTAIRSG